jgi:DNA (cytosine-5)-methyltransferase 1
MKLVSLFTGIGGFDLGADRAGLEVVAQVEQDLDCISILKRHWPKAEVFTDVKDFSAVPFRPDVVCGGFPCQDISVAGQRAGLAGERSGLWYEFHRILSEQLPRWFVIENVAGLLSSWSGDTPDSLGFKAGPNSRELDLDENHDLTTIIDALADLGYGVAWRTFDSQWFGVPQRRRRVFIVGCLGDPRRPAEVLFERESLPWDPAPSREAKTGVAALTATGVGTCGADDGQAQAGHLIPDVANSISTDDRKYDPTVDTFIVDGVAATLRSEGYDATEDGTGKVTLIPVPIQEVGRRMTQHGSGVGDAGDPMFTLQAKTEHAVAIPFDTTQLTSPHNRSNPQPGDPCHSLASDAHVPAIAFQERGRPEGRTVESQDDLAYSIMSKDGGGRSQENCVAYQAPDPFVFEPRIGRCDRGEPSDVVNTLKGSEAGDTSDMRPVAVYQEKTDYAVRRLMPVECERLQGFPDDWTKYTAAGKQLKDGPRYRMLGNAVTVNVAEWIFKRIMQVERGTK